MAFEIKGYEDINRLKAKVRKSQREKKLVQLSKGTYESSDDMLTRYNSEMSGFFFKIGGERILLYEAIQQLEEYKPLIFNRNDTREGFAQMHVSLRKFHKSLRLFEVADRYDKVTYYKVVHLEIERYSCFQRIKNEVAEKDISDLQIITETLSINV